jgi:hypothetical protein
MSGRTHMTTREPLNYLNVIGCGRLFTEIFRATSLFVENDHVAWRSGNISVLMSTLTTVLHLRSALESLHRQFTFCSEAIRKLGK